MGHKSASMVVYALNARSAVGHQSVSTAVCALDARSAVGDQSASTVMCAITARSVLRHDGVNTPRMYHAVPPLNTLNNTRVRIQTSTNRAKLRRTRNRTIPRRSTPPRLHTRPRDWLNPANRVLRATKTRFRPSNSETDAP